MVFFQLFKLLCISAWASILVQFPTEAVAAKWTHNHNHHGGHSNGANTVPQGGDNNYGEDSNTVIRWRNDSVYLSNIFLKLYGEFVLIDVSLELGKH